MNRFEIGLALIGMFFTLLFFQIAICLMQESASARWALSGILWFFVTAFSCTMFDVRR